MISNTLYAWFVRGAEHAAMCRTSVEAVKRVDPNGRCVVVTDEERPQWLIPDTLLLKCEPGQPIMLANLEAQILALSAAWLDGYERIVFLDTDTIMLRTPPAHGDVSFTWRDAVGIDEDGEKVKGVAERMPYNYGVVTAVPGLKSMEAFIWMRERIRNMHPTHQQWYGNQLAAGELAGARPKAKEGQNQVVPRQIPWKLTRPGKRLMVGKLTCETYNYTPKALGEDVADKYVLHFKGHRRDLMEPWAKGMGLGWYVQQSSDANPAAA